MPAGAHVTEASTNTVDRDGTTTTYCVTTKSVSDNSFGVHADENGGHPHVGSSFYAVDFHLISGGDRSLRSGIDQEISSWEAGSSLQSKIWKLPAVGKYGGGLWSRYGSYTLTPLAKPPPFPVLYR